MRAQALPATVARIPSRSWGPRLRCKHDVVPLSAILPDTGDNASHEASQTLARMLRRGLFIAIDPFGVRGSAICSRRTVSMETD